MARFHIHRCLQKVLRASLMNEITNIGRDVRPLISLIKGCNPCKCTIVSPCLHVYISRAGRRSAVYKFPMAKLSVR